MYTQTLSNKELIVHHNLVKYNTSLTLEEIIDNPLFIVEEQNNGELYKIIPLFNCDEIISTNPNDKFLEKRCIICVNDDNTILSFISNIAISGFEINYTITQKYGETIFIGLILDSINKIKLANIDVKIELFNRNYELKKRYYLETDVFGGVVTSLEGYSNTDKIRVTASYNDLIEVVEV